MEKNSRDKKSQETVARIMKAAKKVMAENGYASTTISKVAEEAGVSRGLLHYHFKNKEEMLAKALRGSMEVPTESVFNMLIQVRTVEEYAEIITGSVRELYRLDPEFFILFIEGLAAARHSKTVHDELSSLYAFFKVAIKDSLEHLQKNGVLPPDLNPLFAATAIGAILDGISVEISALPELAEDKDFTESIHQAVVSILR